MSKPFADYGVDRRHDPPGEKQYKCTSGVLGRIAVVKKHGKVAAIMRTKDRPVLLKRALESVINQTETDWVISLVNDGGDQKVLDTLLEQYEPRLKGRLNVTHHAQSKGMEAASNAGIQAVDSKYCIIHDDDDAWLPDFCAKTIWYLEHAKIPTMKGVVTESTRIWEKIEGDTVTEEWREDWGFNKEEVSLWNMCARNTFPPIAFLYERSVYEKVGYYDSTLPVLGDWEFNLRFLRHYDIGQIPEQLALYYSRTSAQGAQYFSTVTHQGNDHYTYGIHIRNRMLREDLDKGQIGLGTLMSIGHGLQPSHETLGIVRWMQQRAQSAFARAKKHKILSRFI